MNGKASGWLNGLIGVLIFSGSLPATRVAVATIDPLFLTFARAAIAGLVGGLFLLGFRSRRPPRDCLIALAIVAFGVVIGFPLLTALALQHITSAHAIVFVGLLPLSTALFGVLRGGERPSRAFWFFAGMGGLLIALYAGAASAVSASPFGDSLMLAAILVCGLGYAEGAKLARFIGGWQVICWALVISLPITLPLAALTHPAVFTGIGAAAWWALAYVSLFSMLIGFVFWYRGLAQGGIAGVGQLQLLQPFFGLTLTAIFLHEQVGWPIIAVTAGVVLCVGGAKRCAA